jgi:hypothetical protein
MKKEYEDYLFEFFNNNMPDLYLGAGFSFGAKRKDGTSIPLGQDFKKEMINHFFHDDADLREELKIKRLEEVCEMVKQVNEVEYNKYITKSFSDFFPEPFHFYLTDYRWPAIYSVNVDDIVEKTFGSNHLPLSIFERKRDVASVNSKENKLFKLHGSINSEKEGYIFSSSEYDELSNDTTDYRLMKFVIALHEKPFVVIGSELNERELDSLIYLYKRSNKDLFLQTVIFINPKPSAYFKRHISSFPKWKLLEASTEEFLTFIHKNKNKIISNYYSLLSTIKRNGCLSVNLLQKDIAKEAGYKSRLYFGYAPVWEDAWWGYLIKYNRLEEIQNTINARKYKYFSLYGRIYSGKTSALMNLFINLSQVKDNFCIYFNNEEISINGIKQILNAVSERNIFLFIDDAADYYSLFDKIGEIDERLSIIAMSNTSLHRRKRYVLDHTKTYEMDINRLDQEDIEKIQKLLISKGYAGELNERPLPEWKNRIGNSNDITSALSKVTKGDKFNDYYRNHFKGIAVQNKDYYPILLICSVLYAVEIPYLPKTLFYKIPIQTDKKIQNKCEDYMQVLRDERFRIASPLIAKTLLETASHEDLIHYIIQISETISGLVTEKEKSYWKTIYEYLTKYKNLKSVLIFSDNEIDTIYTIIMPYYSDRSYYWLQKGLLEQSQNNYDLANNHFDSALAIHSASYAILHAKARNYCKQAVYISELSKGIFYFEEGKKIFTSLIERYEYKQNKAYSIHSLVNERIIFCKKYNIDMDKREIKNTLYLLNDAISNDQNDSVMRELRSRFLLFSKKLLKMANFDNDLYEEYIDE